MTCRHTRFAYLDVRAEGGWGGLAWLQASFLGKHLLMWSPHSQHPRFATG